MIHLSSPRWLARVRVTRVFVIRNWESKRVPVTGKGGDGCEYCVDPNGDLCFPIYGLAPHEKAETPENFAPDPESPGCGTYTHCPRCGASA